MDDKGEIICLRPVDEKLSLGIWSKNGPPRLLIENTAKKSGARKKLIHLNWVEKEDRRLSISGVKINESYNYEMRQLEPIIQSILVEYSVYSRFKMFYWKTITSLSNMIGTPTTVINPADIAFMPEIKRYYLWICDLSKNRSEGFYRPFFPMTEAERNLMPSPEGIPFTDEQKGSEYIVKTGIIRKLMDVNPTRWYRPLQIAAAAMLLSFSFCGEDGSEMTELLWNVTDTPTSFKPDYSKMMKLGERLNLYIRHFNAIKDIKCEYFDFDSVAEMQKREYERKRRFDIPVGAIGNNEYTVTVLEKDNEPTAFTCVSRSIAANKEKEIVYHIPQDVLLKTQRDDTLDEVNLDELFSLTSLIKVKQCHDWLERIAFFVSAFTGVKTQNS